MTLLILVLRAYSSRLSVIVFFNCNYYLIAVRQYFTIAIHLTDQNHVMRLLQWNNIAMNVIYWIIAQPYIAMYENYCPTLVYSRVIERSRWGQNWGTSARKIFLSISLFMIDVISLYFVLVTNRNLHCMWYFWLLK